MKPVRFDQMGHSWSVENSAVIDIDAHLLKTLGQTLQQPSAGGARVSNRKQTNFLVGKFFAEHGAGRATQTGHFAPRKRRFPGDAPDSVRSKKFFHSLFSFM